MLSVILLLMAIILVLVGALWVYFYLWLPGRLDDIAEKLRELARRQIK